MRLYIVRHAWAEDLHPERHGDDRHRPLTKEGTARFATAAKLLVARGLEADVIATSPLIRCRQTAELLAEALDGEVPVIEVPALAPGADLSLMCSWSQEQACESLVWVGHMPDVSYLTSNLIGGGNIRFAKGTAAEIRFPTRIRPGQGELAWLLTAKQLGC